MCGRFDQHSPTPVYASPFGLEVRWDAAPRYNVSPTDAVLAVRTLDGRRELTTLRWGLVPPWFKGPGRNYSMINAWAGTVDEKPAYREAFRHRRCAIPVDGFYEWKRSNGRQPYYFRMKNGEPFALAGIWERWEGNGERIDSCAIIVTTANELVGTVHDRMPVIINPDAFDQWLDPYVDEPERLRPLLMGSAAERLVAYPVSRRVNSPRNQGADLIRPESVLR